MENTTARDAFADPDPGYGERVETARRDLARATAALWSLIVETLAGARHRPWEWVPAAFGETSPKKREHAERAAVMDLAARLRMSELAVRHAATVAERAAVRLPGMWSAFATQGTVSVAHLRAALEVSDHLDDTSCQTFDLQVVRLAEELPPGSMRVRAKRIAERLHRRPLEERHAAAAEGRRVVVEQVEDGMAWLSAFLPADIAHRASARLDACVAELAEVDGETRSRDQLRADTLGDLLTGDGGPHVVKAVVHVEVPVLTLLGRDSRPATLDGTVPIPPSVARRLCGEATVLFRILTDPISSAVVDLDRRRYRPTADLARFVRLRDRVCARPGCTRPARRCDLDHGHAWEHGGSTSAGNLAPLCAPHHKSKHESRWRVTGTHGRLTWTSPTGYVLEPEPPDPPPLLDLAPF